jgi:hypothetical protein
VCHFLLVSDEMMKTISHQKPFRQRFCLASGCGAMFSSARIVIEDNVLRDVDRRLTEWKKHPNRRGRK